MAARDRRLADQDAKLAEQDNTIDEQGNRIARLESDLSQVAEALGELRGEQGESKASAQIEERFRGEGAEPAGWKEHQHKLAVWRERRKAKDDADHRPEN